MIESVPAIHKSLQSNRIELTRPDDWHVHLRDGAVLRDLVSDTARCFGRAVIMPNLKPPVIRCDEALAYRQRILDVLPEGLAFNPLMTLYLTDATTVAEIRNVAEYPEILGLKLYPQGATTNSDSGVKSLDGIYPILEAMERFGVPLLVHGEVTDPDIDIFDREQVFIDRHLVPITRTFPELRVVLEHVTTLDGVQFVQDGSSSIGATITAHHLLYNRNAMLVGGIRPHFFCLPVLKRETHRRALLEAATGKNPRFFLGSDSAPHARNQKESACGCAGSYTAHAAIELYAEAFDSVGALSRLEAFASLNGPAFYGLLPNQEKIILERSSWTVEEAKKFGDQELVPLRAGQEVFWRAGNAG